MLEGFAEIHLPQQKCVDEIPFPSVLSPSNPDLESDLSRFADSVKRQKPELENLLRSSGSIIFRDFPVKTPSDFNRVIEAFGDDELSYVGGIAYRTNIVGRVFTANESPPDQKIPFHSEMAYVPDLPSRLFFFCEVEPGSGGETPLVPSHRAYERMKESYPEFMEKLEQHGLMYTKVLSEKDEPASPVGRGWQSTFLTNDRSIAEERAARLGMKLEWMEDGGVNIIMGPLPGFKLDNRGRKLWVNSMLLFFSGWKDAGTGSAKESLFGDGKPLPDNIVDQCTEILEEESVAIPWKKGDILLIDNHTVIHARRAFDPPRRVLASLCK